MRELNAIDTDQPLAPRLAKEFRQAVARVLEPDEQRLRLPAHVLAVAFVGMVFDGVRPAALGEEPLPAEQIVDLFLHGALSTG